MVCSSQNLALVWRPGSISMRARSTRICDPDRKFQGLCPWTPLGTSPQTPKFWRIAAAAMGALFLWTAPAMAKAGEPPPARLITRLSPSFHQASFQLDITDLWQPLPREAQDPAAKPHPNRRILRERYPGQIELRRVSITCQTGCRKSVRFTEDTLDAPLGAIQPTDLAPQIVTLWSGATNYSVRIYAFDSEHASKVFDHTSEAPPSIILAASGAYDIITYERNANWFENHTLDRLTWHWDGAAYQLIASDKKT